MRRLLQTALLTDNQGGIVGEHVLGHLQVQRGRSLANAPRRIVMGSVAGTVVAAKVSRVGNWHASQVCAHAQHNQPLGPLRSLLEKKQMQMSKDFE